MRLVSIYKIALAPLLLAQGRSMRRTAMRLPEAAGQRTGIVLIQGDQSELSLLFVGDSTMAGVGVQNQASALAFQVASILANRMGRSVRWQLVAKSGVNTSQALGLVHTQSLLPVDVVITALGTNDVTSQRKPDQFIGDYEVLISHLLHRVEAKFVVISGLPPLHLTPAAPQPLRWYLGSYARLLDDCLRRWIVRQRNITYVSLQWASNPKEMAADGYHPGERQYRVWAGLVAESIASLLAPSEAS
jgi:lysophospholipase L1-like esterase